jgi:hypothetical protein
VSNINKAKMAGLKILAVTWRHTVTEPIRFEDTAERECERQRCSV